MKNINRQLPIILCVGSNKFIGDKIAPVIGTILKDVYGLQTYLFGCEKNNIDSTNLLDYYNTLKAYFKNKIIVIDCAVCYYKDFLKITALNKGIRSVACPHCVIGDKSIIINSYCLDKAVNINDKVVYRVAYKIALFIKRYINFKLQIL